MFWFVLSCLYIVVITSFVDASIRLDSAREIVKEGLRLAAYFSAAFLGVAAALYLIARLAYG